MRLIREQKKSIYLKNKKTMYWTLELASKLEDAPWPATKDELIDYANAFGRSVGSNRKLAGDGR